MPKHMLLVPSLTEICPLSDEMSHHTKYVLTDGRQMGDLQPVWEIEQGLTSHQTHPSARKVYLTSLWSSSLTLKTFSAISTHMVNICGKFHWNPSNKYMCSDNASHMKFSWPRNDLDLWSLTLRPLSAMPTHTTNSNAEESVNNNDGLLISSAMDYLWTVRQWWHQL